MSLLNHQKNWILLFQDIFHKNNLAMNLYSICQYQIIHAKYSHCGPIHFNLYAFVITIITCILSSCKLFVVSCILLSQKTSFLYTCTFLLIQCTKKTIKESPKSTKLQMLQAPFDWASTSEVVKSASYRPRPPP